ncbi:pilus assembly protein [Azohydromonas sediminis]|uniref:pilus assembly protein n=1 Tax=Azohydromonas sediminis TaxID=2259674 RepID=UPI000E65AE59|nr:PilC/PilY family type IV pilus protein [Azohydromonas sediminis]
MNVLRQIARYAVAALAGLVLVGAGIPASAVDISPVPLVTSAGASVKPNMLFILDDSGSMDWDYMPDWVNDNFCRAAGATATNSGTWNRACCQNDAGSGSGSNACWRSSNFASSPVFGTWRGHPPYLASAFNGVAYNPAVRYQPPLDANGNPYPSMTASNTAGWTSVRNDHYNVQFTSSINLLTQFPDTAWCTDTTYTDCLRNGNYVLPGTVNGKSYTTYRPTVAIGTGLIAIGAPDAATTQWRTFGPHYYAIVPGEYCTDTTLRNCQATASATHPVPAYVRWCNSDANARAATPAAGSCQAVRTATYNQVRYPTKFATPGAPAVAATPGSGAKATFTVMQSGTCNGSNQVAYSAVMVNGVNLLAANTVPTTGNNNIAANIRTQINNKTVITGYTAGGTGNTVVITAPVSAGNISHTVMLIRSGSNACTVSISPSTPTFSGYVAPTPAIPATPAGYAGRFERIDIVPSVTSYPKAPTRTDCAGGTCTYEEEMTNFANWWTYYRTRMQMMKTSASIAFAPVSDQFRLGYLSINNGTGSDFLNLDTFAGTHKTNWFDKLRAARPSGWTPLRTALSRAGRLYAGQLNGQTLNGSTVVDPMTVSCQQNFTLLSTDGYWNETATPVRIDGSTAIGNVDGSLDRPYRDGTNTSNSLSDVAAYYYLTDLRTPELNNCTGPGGVDLCQNNVPTAGDDTAPHQHMTTFTLGLGAPGYMLYDPNYRSATSGDYHAVANGTTANPAAGVCSWQAAGTVCTWPAPVNNTETAIDDMWHAAVNGRGTYFAATDPASLYTGLSNALAQIDRVKGAAAAATTSNPNISAGDNFLYLSRYVTNEWSGELLGRQISATTGEILTKDEVDPTTGEKLPLDSDWSARDLLDGNASRTLFMHDPSNTSTGRRPFDWDHLTAAERAYFGLAHITAPGQSLSQFCTFGSTCLPPSVQSAAAGERLVNFLRGVRTDEGEATQLDKPFRKRAHLLGDIVNSEAVFVGKPMFNYADSGYSAFKTSMMTRQGMVYVGANDGMLHAFNADTGVEEWAFVPSMVLPKLYRLADKDYANRHQFYVDATPTAGDVRIDGAWRTILVGGLGAGGSGYYALDVTDPASPKVLWEFTHPNLGLTFGRPDITKLKDGTWVVIFGSGYNHTGASRLFIVDAKTGVLIRTITTSTGSGLAHVRSWVDKPDVDNTVKRVYGGDNDGNLWRFDVNGDIDPAGHDAHLLATLRGPAGNVQPLTARPELGLVAGRAVVFVGTGRYLGTPDLTDDSPQSIYAIEDPLDGTTHHNPRTLPTFVNQTLTAGTCPSGATICTPGQEVRTGSHHVVDFATHDGWYIDLPLTRERANTDPQLVLGTLVMTTNIPEQSACSVGGKSYINFFDYRTGAPVATATGVASVALGNALATRPTVVRLEGGGIRALTRLSNDRTVVSPVPVSLPGGTARRLSWRELAIEE